MKSDVEMAHELGWRQGQIEALEAIQKQRDIFEAKANVLPGGITASFACNQCMGEVLNLTYPGVKVPGP